MHGQKSIVKASKTFSCHVDILYIYVGGDKNIFRYKGLFWPLVEAKSYTHDVVCCDRPSQELKVYNYVVALRVYHAVNQGSR